MCITRSIQAAPLLQTLLIAFVDRKVRKGRGRRDEHYIVGAVFRYGEYRRALVGWVGNRYVVIF
jgi:hypothetical protein